MPETKEMKKKNLLNRIKWFQGADDDFSVSGSLYPVLP